MSAYQNLKLILRRLGRTPGFTAITLITLAIGIGANTAIFSVVDGVLLKPLPYSHPEQLVNVSHTAWNGHLQELSASPSTYFIYRDQSRAFRDIGLYLNYSVNLTEVEQPEQVRALAVTDGTLPILGIKPVLGRWFSRFDDLPSSPPTVMLTYGYWHRKFGGSSSIIGHMITVNGRQREVIGVMPQEFHFLDQDDPPLILPFQLDRNKTLLGQFSYFAVARLKPGVTLADANADVARMLPIVLHSFPPPPGFSLQLFEKAQIGPRIQPLKQELVGDVGNALWVLLGAIGIVLLIACANVANLLLIRIEGRRQEFAVRSALGAGRTRLAADLLLENLILGLIGGVLGLGLSYGALQLLPVMATELPRIREIGIDVPELLFALAASLFASVLISIVPVLKSRNSLLNTGLLEGGRTSSRTWHQRRAWEGLVVVQVSMALVLLTCSGLMIRTFRALREVNPGFWQPSQVQTFRFFVSQADVSEPERVVRTQEAILERIAAIPGVKSVGLTTAVPMDSSSAQRDPIHLQDQTYTQGEVPALRLFKFVSPGLLRTLGVPLIAGRDFAWTDIYNNVPVALVSENLAREYWHDPSMALGKRIRVGSDGKDDDWREIIGVAANVHDYGVSQDAPTSVYWPILMSRFEGNETRMQRTLCFAIRSPRTGTESLMREVQQAVWSVDANIPLADIRTLDHFYKQSMARTSFTLVMLGISGAVGLLLGIVGLYSVIAYSVAQRRKEIGIRMALGAQRDALVRMFVRQGLVLTSLGLICGLGAAVGLTRLMRSLLFHVSTLDPMTYIGVTAVLVVTAIMASYVPSRQAASVDPMETLRAE